MALDREIARLSKILVDAEGITFPEAEARLRALKLEIVVGSGADSAAAHMAVLTALSVGRRSFVGGVRVVGDINQRANALLPIPGDTLAQKCAHLGADAFEGAPICRVCVGSIRPDESLPRFVSWWDGWKAGVRSLPVTCGDGRNPLAGIAAAALSVGAAFEFARGKKQIIPADVNLWGIDGAPGFDEVFLPDALWFVGLGNLGQAYLWALTSLPYEDPSKVAVILQDDDRVSPENWATSVLVHEESYGVLKGKVVERWAESRGFDTRRIDRRLTALDRRMQGEPSLAISGLDKNEGRRNLGVMGFKAIVDAGLGRTAADYDKFAVRVFDQNRLIDRHFAVQVDEQAMRPPEGIAYEQLEEEIGRCGVAEIGGASVAAPFVSALAAAVVLSRAIALASGCPCLPSEVRRVSSYSLRKPLMPIEFQTRGIGHASRPALALLSPLRI